MSSQDPRGREPKAPLKKPTYPVYEAKGEGERRTVKPVEQDYRIDPPARLKIVTLAPQHLDLVIEAQFNPKEIQVDGSITLAKHKDKHGVAALEYTGREPRTVSLELLFDGFESATGVGPHLAALEQLLRHMPGTDFPPPLALVWGGVASRDDPHLPAFTVMLESLSIKRTMYSRDGKCLRATANLKLKEIPEGGVRRGK